MNEPPSGPGTELMAGTGNSTMILPAIDPAPSIMWSGVDDARPSPLEAEGLFRSRP